MKTTLRILAIPAMYVMAYLFSQPYEWWMGPTVALGLLLIFFAMIGELP